MDSHLADHSAPPSSNQLPRPTTVLQNVTWNAVPIAKGSYANIYRGKWHGQLVALKQLRSRRQVEEAHMVTA